MLLFLLTILRLFIKEGFEDVTLTKTTIDDYNRFKTFYNEFIKNWNTSITTAIVSEIPIEKMPLKPYKPTEDDMNSYIKIVSINEKKPFPKITPLLPDEINISDIIPRIPQDSTPYINALAWMNSKLQNSMLNLGSAINSIKIEQFEDKCQDLSNCINNPTFLATLSNAQKKNELDQIKSNEKILSERINMFFSNKQLDELSRINQQLIKDANDIKNRAQSGKLVNNIVDSLNTNEKGSNDIEEIEKIKKIKKIDPNIKDKYPLIASMKSLFDGINSA